MLAEYERDFYSWLMEQTRHLRERRFDALDRDNLEMADVLADNPGLKPRIDEAIARTYRRARIEAAKETGLEEAKFPAECLYSFEDITSRVFTR